MSNMMSRLPGKTRRGAGLAEQNERGVRRCRERNPWHRHRGLWPRDVGHRPHGAAPGVGPDVPERHDHGAERHNPVGLPARPCARLPTVARLSALEAPGRRAGHGGRLFRRPRVDFPTPRGCRSPHRGRLRDGPPRLLRRRLADMGGDASLIRAQKVGGCIRPRWCRRIPDNLVPGDRQVGVRARRGRNASNPCRRGAFSLRRVQHLAQRFCLDS